MNDGVIQQAPIHIIGIDDSGPASLSSEELRLIEGAELLCGGERHLALFRESNAKRFVVRANLPDLYATLAAAGQRRTVVLASGDPCYFGIGPLIAAHCGRERAVIHPRANSVSLAFARLGLAWQDATVLSVHGRPLAFAIPAALGSRKLAFLTDDKNTPAAIATALLQAGMEDCPAFVCERLGGAQEHIVSSRLAALPGQRFDPLNVLIVLREPVATPGPAIGRADSDYDTLHGQQTKAEVRAISIARLEPWRAATAWDIGAGSGSVAIELAGQMAGRPVYAVEREQAQLEVLRRNLERHRAGNVRVVAAEAPAVLAPLPAPDAVFIGGSGGALESILRAAVARLRPGGRVVTNLTLLEHLAIWQHFAEGLGWPHDLAQVAVSRAETLGGGTRLVPLGPVFITRIVRPETGSEDLAP